MTAGNEVAWLFEVEVKPERWAEYEALVPEMVDSTRAEKGARAYQHFKNHDTNTVCIYERYADSDAAMTHMGIFGEKFAARFMDMVSPIRFTVLGTPSEQLTGALAPIGAVVHSPVGGFSS